jgi:hypothetical protein
MKKFIIIVLLLICTSTIRSQVSSGFYTLKSCYQEIPIDMNKTTPNKILSVNGNTKFNISSTVAHSRYFQIYQYNSTNEKYQIVQTSGINGSILVNKPNPYINDGELTLLFAWNNEYSNTFDFSDNADFDPNTPFKIAFWVATQSEPNGPVEYFEEKTLDFQFVGADESFSISPTSNSCFTFNNFKFNFLNDLEGLCKMPDFKMTIPNSLMPTGFETITIEPNNGLPYGPSYNIPQPSAGYCNQFSNQVLPPGYYPNPVPSGCLDFTFNITILPCNDREGDNDCPPLIINKTIKICCSCDIRQPQPLD